MRKELARDRMDARVRDLPPTIRRTTRSEPNPTIPDVATLGVRWHARVRECELLEITPAVAEELGGDRALVYDQMRLRVSSVTTQRKWATTPLHALLQLQRRRRYALMFAEQRYKEASTAMSTVNEIAAACGLAKLTPLASPLFSEPDDASY